MAVNPYDNEETNTVGGVGNVKNISDALKKVSGGEKSSSSSVYSEFKVANSNLPEKTGFWTKLKNALFYEVKIELTPYQQKVENEINDFLHQEITWKSLKEAALSEVPITFRGKRIF